MHKILRDVMCFAAVMVLAGGVAGAADWPQWRGPERNAISRETGLLKTWPAGGPKVLWEAPLGAGYACVSVAQGRVFTMYQDKVGQYLVALDEKTGKPLWKVTVGPYYMARAYPGARPAPTVDGDRVYAIDATGNVVCVKAADGAPVWKVNVIELAGAVNMMWGFGSAPFISGEMLLVCAGNKNNGTDSDQNVPAKPEGSSILALDKKTGKVIWKALDEAAEYSTPMEFKSGGIDQFVFLTMNNVVGVARRDGKLLWSYPYLFKVRNANIATPIVNGDMIWVGSAYNVGSTVLQVDLTKTPAVREVWKAKVLQAHFATPVLIDGYLYGYDADRLECVNFKTGEKMWTDTTILKGQLVYADGLFYVFGERGDLGLARLTPQKAEFLGKIKLMPGQQRWSMPVIANGRLYVRDDKKLLCLDVKAH